MYYLPFIPDGACLGLYGECSKIMIRLEKREMFTLQAFPQAYFEVSRANVCIAAGWIRLWLIAEPQ